MDEDEALFLKSMQMQRLERETALRQQEDADLKRFKEEAERMRLKEVEERTQELKRATEKVTQGTKTKPAVVPLIAKKATHKAPIKTEKVVKTEKMEEKKEEKKNATGSLLLVAEYGSDDDDDSES